MGSLCKALMVLLVVSLSGCNKDSDNSQPDGDGEESPLDLSETDLEEVDVALDIATDTDTSEEISGDLTPALDLTEGDLSGRDVPLLQDLTADQRDLEQFSDLQNSDGLFIDLVETEEVSGDLATDSEDIALPCLPEPGVPGEDVFRTMLHDGVMRSYNVHIPTGYRCEPVPLVLGIHGYYGSGDGFENRTAEMFNHINENGYIGIFPDGLSMSSTWDYVTSFNDLGSRNDDGPDGMTCTADSYNYGSYDNCGPSEMSRSCHWGTSCADDEGFFRALVEEAQEQWTIDESRIYMTGFSQGGQTVQSMACPMSDILAAIAPSHGFSANGYTCAPETPMAMMQVWGLRDSIVPGDDGMANDGMIYDSADETALEWAVSQGCDVETSVYPTVSDGAKDWVCVQHDNCETGSEVVTCSWDGGHNWSTDSSFGDDFSGNFSLEAIWEFFELHHQD
jgi:polyhydroxybutyrate depolymerase